MRVRRFVFPQMHQKSPQVKIPYRRVYTLVHNTFVTFAKVFRSPKEKLRMKKASFLVFILLFLGVNIAVAQDVTFNFDQGADFSKFKTYKWVSIKNAQQVDEITARQITAAIDTELTKKGLTKTEANNADLYVAYQTAIGTQKQWSAYNTGWGYGPR
jgi:hypothetical protein